MQRADYEQWKASEVARLLALVEAERRYYQDIFSALPVAVAVLAPDLGFAAVNREFRRMLLPPQADLSKLKLPDVITDAALHTAVAEVMNTGVPQSVRIAQLSAGGAERALRISVQKTTCWEADSGEELLITVEESASVPPGSAPAAGAAAGGVVWPVLAWECDPATFYFSKLSGDPSALPGESHADWLTLETRAQNRVLSADRARYLDFYRNWMARHERGVLDYRALSEQGAICWRRDKVIARGGRLAGLTSDVTLERQEEQWRIEEAKRAGLERLSGRLAHVANNLLMIIGGYAEELAARFPEGDDSRSDLDEILKATERMARLTRDLTSLTRPPAYESSPFDAARWVQGASERLRALLPEGASLNAEPGKPGLMLNTSAALLDQIAVEAVKQLRAVLSPSGALRLSAEAVEPEQAAIKLEFEAPAIPAEAAERFFEPFSGEKEGTDPPIGLAALVRPWQRLGGTMSLETEPGDRLRLVLTCAAVTVPPAPEVAGTVLLVEDEPGIRSLIAKALERNHYHVEVAERTADALERFQGMTEPVDLLITDLMVPGGSGRQFAEYLRAQWPSVKVIFISGYTDDAELAGQIGSGTLPAGTRFLSKPFSVAQLLEEVRSLLSRADP
jgi:CheY-like chemotaxis protein/signal transduction histidine kinase